MTPLEDSRIRELLLPYQVVADEHLCEAIRTYVALLLQWNSKIALTTVTDPEEMVRFHFGESFFAVSKIDISKGRLADIGTGPGFPGIPIRMVSPYVDVTLVEANAKKAAFLAEVIRRLKIDGITVVRSRMEDVSTPELGKFDFVIARALGNYDSLLSWCENALSPLGKIVLWLGEAEATAISENKNFKWDNLIRIPDARSRFLLSGTHL